MLVNKNLNIQVPAGKTVVLPDQSPHSATTGSLIKEQEAVSAAANSPASGPCSSKKQQVPSAVVAMICFEDTIDPKDYLALDSKTTVSRRIWKSC
jgi:hypothetical protein